MNSTTHPVAPEQIMALVDGELSAEERQAVNAHLEQCAECAAVRDEFLRTSEALAQWTVPEPPPSLNRAVEAKIAESSRLRGAQTPRAYTPMSVRNWRLWAIGGGGAVFGMLMLVAVIAVKVAPRRQLANMQGLAVIQEESLSPNAGQSAYAYSESRSRAASEPIESLPLQGKNMTALAQLPAGVIGGTVPPPLPSTALAPPMIARTVSLTIRVKDIAASRAALDGILAQHHGYAASLTLNTPEDGARSFQSSLRIPAPNLQAGLDALRKLGRVQTETQSGEEVTQQHADLVARLTNARETEQRLRQLEAERTGKMEDVLDVEEKISETRGEIETMEAEQALLEHRVAFATIDLQLMEEYKEQLATGSSVSTGTRMHNAFIAGMRNAGGTLLGLALFFEEYGPVLLIWIAILGGPAFLIWRRYRRFRGGN